MLQSGSSGFFLFFSLPVPCCMELCPLLPTLCHPECPLWSPQCLDASRPWLCYWILHSLELLDEPIPDSVASE